MEHVVFQVLMVLNTHVVSRTTFLFREPFGFLKDMKCWHAYCAFNNWGVFFFSEFVFHACNYRKEAVIPWRLPRVLGVLVHGMDSI